jgi:hypothetical protein
VLTLVAAVTLAGCSAAPAPAAPSTWDRYDDLADLRDDATLVVEGVVHRLTGDDDAPVAEVSLVGTLLGAEPADDPLRVLLDPDVPIDLQPGTRYVLFLAPAGADGEGPGDLVVVGPGAWSQPRGTTGFVPPDGAPASLPADATADELAGR